MTVGVSNMSRRPLSRRPAFRRTQSGISLVGLIFWGVVVSSVALVIMRVAPALGEYRTILSMVNKAAKDGGSTVPEIRASFDRFKQIEYGVESITSRNLDITKENEQVVIKFAYDKEIELVQPVYLLIKFEGRSK